MANIRVLEILPVEAQLEDLSDDMTSRIQGGQEPTRWIEGFLDALNDTQQSFLDLVREWLQFWGTDPNFF